MQFKEGDIVTYRDDTLPRWRVDKVLGENCYSLTCIVSWAGVKINEKIGGVSSFNEGAILFDRVGGYNPIFEKIALMEKRFNNRKKSCGK